MGAFWEDFVNFEIVVEQIEKECSGCLERQPDHYIRRLVHYYKLHLIHFALKDLKTKKNFCYHYEDFDKPNYWISIPEVQKTSYNYYSNYFFLQLSEDNFYY